MIDSVVSHITIAVLAVMLTFFFVTSTLMHRSIMKYLPKVEEARKICKDNGGLHIYTFSDWYTCRNGLSGKMRREEDI